MLRKFATFRTSWLPGGVPPPRYGEAQRSTGPGGGRKKRFGQALTHRSRTAGRTGVGGERQRFDRGEASAEDDGERLTLGAPRRGQGGQRLVERIEHARTRRGDHRLVVLRFHDFDDAAQGDDPVYGRRREPRRLGGGARVGGDRFQRRPVDARRRRRALALGGQAAKQVPR